MALWHGFKQYAVDLGLTVRRQLGILPSQRLNVYELAEHYGISLVNFGQLGCTLEALHHFTVGHWKSVSGFLLPVDGAFAIVTNPSHSALRIRATIAHEVAHFILNHEFSVLAATDEGCVFGDEDQEDEAKWLGAELLLPRPIAKKAVLDGMPLHEVSKKFGVSIELARWRTNISGGYKMRQRVEH